MAVRIGTGLSAAADVREGARLAADEARAGLNGAPCDLAIVFAAGAHVADPSAALAAVHETLEPAALAGCASSGVLATGHEVEEGTAISVWAASLGGDASAETFGCVVEPLQAGTGALAGVPELTGSSGAVLLCDAQRFPTDPVLRFLSERVPGVPLLGGLASARFDGQRALLLGEHASDVGAVGVRFEGVELLPCVSQGARPLGPELTITDCEGNVIRELAGKPALEKLRDTVSTLGEPDRELIENATGGLLVGIVIDPNQPEYEQGDFLVRPLVGADQASGAIAVGEPVEPGQVVRLHARDASSAHRDLAQALDVRRSALGGAPAAGALVFSCNGRGRAMFGEADHDAGLIERTLGAPAAGCFCAGEIGPVGGDAHLHSFTATVAVFAG